MRKHLTEMAVRGLKPAEKQFTVFDTQTPGFGVLVGLHAKSWLVVHGSKRSKKVLGRYPEMSLADARKEAKRILVGLFEQGSSVVFEDALPKYLAEHFDGKSERTKKEAKRLLEKHFKSTLKRTKLSDIEDKDLNVCLTPIKAPSERLHAFRAATTFFKWCTRPPRRWIRHSPMEGYLPPGKQKSRDRVLSEEELKAVWQNAVPMIRLLILWGIRKGECRHLLWQWFDAELLVIPGENTKNGRDHTLPLLPLAKETLQKVEGHNRNNHLFPARYDADKPLHDGSWGKFKKALDEASGVSGWTIHDLRRTFSTNLARLGVPKLITEKLLNHVQGEETEVSRIYDRYDYLAEKRDALAKWEAYLSTLTSGTPTPPAG